MLVRMGRFVGIDYGEKRVGVAVSDDSATFAFPNTVLSNNEQLLDELAAIGERESAEAFVLGLADNPKDGAGNHIAHRVGIIAEALRVRTNRPVMLVSEAYSSAEARRPLEPLLATRSDARHNVDASAAAIILQSFLDARAHEHKNT